MHWEKSICYLFILSIFDFIIEDWKGMKYEKYSFQYINFMVTLYLTIGKINFKLITGPEFQMIKENLVWI